jgi:8-oxo-dGTP pyrophosphatase MutT (NUDIX family)
MIPERFDLERLKAALSGREAIDLPEHARRAAVAALFRDEPDGLEILLIRRAVREGDPWSGHMALPGGHFEPGDQDLLDTALRETREELGISLARDTHFIGRLNDFSPFKNADLCVRPFVFGVGELPPFTLSNEVQEVLWTKVRPLIAGECESKIDLDYGSQRFSMPAWDVQGRIVWGLTYRVLQSLFEGFRTGPAGG